MALYEGRAHCFDLSEGTLLLDLGLLLGTHTRRQFLGRHDPIPVESIHVSTSRLCGVVARVKLLAFLNVYVIPLLALDLHLVGTVCTTETKTPNPNFVW